MVDAGHPGIALTGAALAVVITCNVAHPMRSEKPWLDLAHQRDDA